MTDETQRAAPVRPANHSETLDQLFTALAKAQGAMRPAEKEGWNPHFESRYSTLASCWEACRGPLSSNGLAVVQLPERTADGVRVTTILGHTSGQWISSVCILPAKGDAQGVGSAITYARRYGLCSVVGIAPDDDDDANATTTPRPPPRRDARPQPPPTRTAPTPVPKPPPSPGTIGAMSREVIDDKTGEVRTVPVDPPSPAPEDPAFTKAAAAIRSAADKVEALKIANAVPQELRKRIGPVYREVWGGR